MPGDLLLITGATGMIGYRTLVSILKAGYTVRAAARSQASFDRIAALPSVQPYLSQLSSVIVPEITTPGAYNDAVKGVKYVVHIASPIPSGKNIKDYDAELIQPAIRGTVGILESATKEPSIKRVVITASVASVSSLAKNAAGEIIDETSRNGATTGPFDNPLIAYAASKALAFQASKDFLEKNKPSYDVINILPVFVFGRDETVTDAAKIAHSTNGLILGPLLGHPHANPLSGAGVHIDDVAEMHVRVLDPKIEGGHDFLASSADAETIQWADSFDIVKAKFPEAYKAGAFKIDETPRPEVRESRVSNKKAREVLGIKFKTFEEQVVSVVDQYLELTGQKA